MLLSARRQFEIRRIFAYGRFCVWLLRGRRWLGLTVDRKGGFMAVETANEISRRDLLLLILGTPIPRTSDGSGLGGITRLQKFLFLLEREEGLKPSGEGFEFTPYKAGPYSSRLYDDLEFLENLGLISREIVDSATEGEAAEADFSFEDLITPEAESAEETVSPTADVYEEHRFSLTPKGEARLKKLLTSGQYRPIQKSVENVKRKYGRYSLNDLLYYVYKHYPDMTTESEIKDKVLSRRSRF
jgi:uncharacterized protein YwgA